MNGFDIAGVHIWDFTKPFSYIEAFSGIFIVLCVSLVGLLLLRHFKPKSR